MNINFKILFEILRVFYEKAQQIKDFDADKAIRWNFR
jgi:hypothetical protein